MTKRMLIDASHPEETRVILVADGQLEDFDFESTTKKQLKGNIYLAKVTRVEPSLQAAFVDYGGNRHGFLPFSEIHPDYYQIPHADRKLLQEQQQAEASPPDSAAQEGNGAAPDGNSAGDESAEPEAVSTDPEEEAAEVFDEQARRRSRLLRSYKIQEVIKRRQILLVQVVKEERGNKGAALTTYLSLAGRYCVLMPNTARGGGISRKIASPADRSRLKAIARELDVPDGMGLIIRTAGQQRNKLEIRRDYDYLLRLWSDIRDLTLKSIAPCTIHEEGALVQRAIRDLYMRDVDEVLVEGEEGYRQARKIMGMLMPSRARRVKPFKEDVPLFHHYQVQEQLDAMHSPVVHLRSGGSIVIHTTEALTAIDVNSGRSTRERNIEETALKTNLEATEEIARQLRLRDLAGLVVIDFIDMAENRNQRVVERKFREALKSDRARVQVGRISAFGLLELSRQRLRPSFQELSTQPCPVCHGLGVIRSTESAALQALRAIELEGLKGGSAALSVTTPPAVALYLLNQKRDRLVSLEQRYGMTIEVQADAELIAGDFDVETVAKAETEVAEADERPRANGAAKAKAPAVDDEEGDGAGKRRRRRRRRRRRIAEGDAEYGAGRANGEDEEAAQEVSAAADGGEDGAEAAVDEDRGERQGGAIEETGETSEAAPGKAAEKPRSRRRRSRPAKAAQQSAGEVAAIDLPPDDGAESPDEPAATAAAEVERPEEASEPPPVAAPAAAIDDVPCEPRPAPEEPAARVALTQPEAEPEPDEDEAELTSRGPTPAAVDQEPEGPPRRGWWSRFVRKDD